MHFSYSPFIETAPTYTVSAVLNVGWASKWDSQDWIHPGDWHNDASHEVDLQDGVSSYMKDIEVVKLGGMGGGEHAPPGDSAVQAQISLLSVTLLTLISMLLMLSVLL